MPRRKFSRRHVARLRGVTLIEVLIVVAIIAMISGGIGVAAVKYFEQARIRTTTIDARAIRGAVKTWWMDHDSDKCPSVDDLIATGTLDKDTRRHDAWGEAWQVVCADDDITVISAGKDRKSGTADDIRVPPT